MLLFFKAPKVVASTCEYFASAAVDVMGKSTDPEARLPRYESAFPCSVSLCKPAGLPVSSSLK